MNRLAGNTIAVVGQLDATALEREGATVVVLDVEEFWSARDPFYDAIVIAGVSADRAVAFVRELRSDERSRRIPRIAVVNAEAGAKLSGSGVVTVDIARGDDEVVTILEDVAALGGGTPDLEERAAQLAREIEDMTKERSALAHDTRVLLAVALGFACNVRDGIGGEINPSQKASLERIVSAVQDASALLERAPASNPRGVPNNVSAMRRVAKRQNVNVESLVRDVHALFEETAAEAAISLTVDSTEPVYAFCDPVQVKQVIVNLVVNALKFTPRDGKVVLSIERAMPTSARGYAARANVQITVSDSGPGVAPEDRARIFERGVRLERDAAIQGKGIGLAVVAEIAKSHFGSVRVEASPLGGAAFVLCLPVDLRKRERGGFLVVEESASAREMMAILALEAQRGADAVGSRAAGFATVAMAADAIVVLPLGASAELRQLLGRIRGDE